MAHTRKGFSFKKRTVLKEVLFDDVEEKIEYDFLTRDQFFTKVPETRPMSVTWYRNVGKIPTRSERI